MNSIFTAAQQQGIVVLMLLGAVVVIGKMLQGALSERVMDLKDRISALEMHVKECDDDRTELWKIVGGRRT